jgi:hypothetical protein
MRISKKSLSRRATEASAAKGKKKSAAWLPIYFETGRGATVIMALHPLRTCKFLHN